MKNQGVYSLYAIARKSHAWIIFIRPINAAITKAAIYQKNKTAQGGRLEHHIGRNYL